MPDSKITRRELLQRSALLGAGIAGGARFMGVLPAHPLQKSDGEIPTPEPHVARFEEMGFGMFLHYGLYSQIGRGEWAKHMEQISTEDYMPLMETFTAENFSGNDLARQAKRAGIRYITLTSRHHDGFSLYDTRGLSSRDITRTPANRDLIEDFVSGCGKEGIVPMVYHTTLDWTDERFEDDFPAYLQYLRESVKTLCTQYGPIGGFWFDGNWSKRDADWEEGALYELIRKHQPEAMIINNTGLGHGGSLGHQEIDSVTFERGRPEPMDRSGHSKYVSAEMCLTLNFHWGIANNDFNYLSPAHVIEELTQCRRAGANLLINVGPMASGALPEYESATLDRVGDWIRLHGGDECPIYRGRPAGITGEERDFGLMLDGTPHLFAFDLTRTADTQAHVSARGAGERKFSNIEGPVKSVVWCDNGEDLTFKHDAASKTLTVNCTGFPYGTNTVVRIARVST